MFQISHGSAQGSIYSIREPWNILKPADEWYRAQINQTETEKKGKTSYKEKMRVLSGWC